MGSTCSSERLPAEVLHQQMKTFEDLYNANEPSKSADFYAESCDVTVNKGEVFRGSMSKEVAGFLDTLRNTLGGTNIRFSVTQINGNTHEDVWVADNGAGSCRAVWKKVGGEWKIVKDAITFTPKMDAAAQPADASTMPPEMAVKHMKAFEDFYNADETSKSAKFYAPSCEVTVNNGDVFKGSTPEEVAGFLGTLRNKLGGTNIKFVITKIEGNVHDDVWVADNGAGSCHCEWALLDGEWRIVKDDIKFTPKATGA